MSAKTDIYTILFYFRAITQNFFKPLHEEEQPIKELLPIKPLYDKMPGYCKRKNKKKKKKKRKKERKK